MIDKKIYLAGRYSRKNELRECKAELESCGHKVTSSWLHELHDPNVQLKEVEDNELETLAGNDLNDITDADAIVFFSEPQNNQPPRGGRHVEFGYALAKGLAMHVIGERENLFHYLPGVKVHATWRDFVLSEVFG